MNHISFYPQRQTEIATTISTTIATDISIEFETTTTIMATLPVSLCPQPACTTTQSSSSENIIYFQIHIAINIILKSIIYLIFQMSFILKRDYSINKSWLKNFSRRFANQIAGQQNSMVFFFIFSFWLD